MCFDRLKPQRDRLDFLRAIIISGDAPRRSIEKIRTIVEEVFRGHKEKIHDSIDPSFVGAVGAALLAKFYSEHPEELEEQVSFSHGLDPEHDEL